MNAKKTYMIYLLLIFLLFTGYSLFGAVTYTTNFTLSNLSFSTEGGYDVISLIGCDYVEEIGKPMLPLKVISLVIPTDMKVTGFTINSCDSTGISGDYNIFPAQPPGILDGSPPPPSVPPDSLIYSST